MESIIINIFRYRNSEISWKCGFSPKNYFRWVTNCQFSITSIDVIQLVLTLEITTAQVVQTSVTFNNKNPIQDYLPRGGGGGTPYMKGVGMLVVSLRGVNFGFRSHLGSSGQNAIIFSREGLV